MSQTPERRADALTERFRGYALWTPSDARTVNAAIARAIRVAENAERKRLCVEAEEHYRAAHMDGAWRWHYEVLLESLREKRTPKSKPPPRKARR